MNTNKESQKSMRKIWIFLAGLLSGAILVAIPACFTAYIFNDMFHYSAASEASIQLKALNLLRDGQAEKAIKLLDITLEGKVINLNIESSVDKTAEFSKKILSDYAAYKNKIIPKAQ